MQPPPALRVLKLHPLKIGLAAGAILVGLLLTAGGPPLEPTPPSATAGQTVNEPNRIPVEWLWGISGLAGVVVILFVVASGLRIAIARRTAQLRATNRALKMLSECNQAMVRAADETTLLNDLCRIIVNIGGYRMAWVGFAENDEAKTVRPTAWAGVEEGYIDSLQLSWADVERGRGPTGAAIRSGQAVTARHILTDPQFGPWRAQALKRGYASSIALPLMAEGRALGALNIYAAEPDAFDDEEIGLLTELASDLTYGLTVLRARAARRQAERDLLASEARYRDLYENAPIAYFTVGTDGLIRQCNRQATELLGHAPGELIGRPVFDLYADTPEGKEKARAIFQRFRDGETIRGEELQVQKAGESNLWIRLFVNPILNDEGRVVESRSAMADITERKRAELRFRSLFEQAHDAVFLLDMAGRHLMANKRAADILGYTLEEVQHLSVEDTSAQPVQSRQVIERLARGEYVPPYERIFRKKDGSAIPVEINVELVRDTDGQPLHIQSVVRDITERKRAEEALRLSEERFSKAFFASPAGMTITRIADGQFIDANDSFLRMFEFSRDEVIGHTSTELKMWPPEERRKVIQQQIESGGLRDFELQAQSKSGRIVHLLFSSKTMELAGEPCLLTTLIDITARKQAEEETRNYLDRLTALNKAALQLQRLHAPQVLASEIMKSLERSLNYTFGSVLLIDEASQRLIPFAVSAQGKGNGFAIQDKKYIESQDIRVGKGVTGWVAQTGVSVRVGDVRQDARYFSIRERIRSELCVPLKIEGRVIGVINVETDRADAYSQVDEDVLETIAAQISIAIQNSRLFERVQAQVAEREQMLEQLRGLSAQLAATEESERRKLSHELHDRMGQSLAALNLNLSIIQSLLPPEALVKVAARLTDSLALVNETVQHIRNVMAELHPPALEEFGLLAALRWYAEQIAARSNITIEVSGQEPEPRLPLAIETALFRVAQEAVNNALKHAHAARITIALEASGPVRLTVADDGAGFDPRAPASGRGMIIMRERAEAVGGRLTVESAPGAGARIIVEV